ncbi:uncharacterized protein A4U43_C10F8820 [Asparagus officinalis]|uniref:Uncharacterized protein n=1 Tax=Asparagus officinalis TaxID=4686 RepID=A0A5P1E1U2_ASPOF|nr:uncharacterized protein LOC109825280 [Asparagus officinalis]ONK56448.1 uncharacterized protein A4U43_C10F8820 [Asparagus officinalis]
MSGEKGFENLEPIFGEAEPESDAEAKSKSEVLSRPVLFYVHALDSIHLEIVVSDFLSHTFNQMFTVFDLDQMRYDIGFGGSWSEFLDYLIASLSLGNVKLTSNPPQVLPIHSDGIHAKLIAQKSKGLPRIALPLSKVMSFSGNEAMADFSLALFRALKDKQKKSIKEHECFLQMKGLLSSEKERNESLQKQLDNLSFVKKRKAHKSKASDKSSFVPDSATNNNTVTVSETQLPSSVSETQPSIANPADGEKPSNDTQPAKASQKVAPTSRRARTRGVSLKDVEDDDD